MAFILWEMEKQGSRAQWTAMSTWWTAAVKNASLMLVLGLILKK